MPSLMLKERKDSNKKMLKQFNLIRIFSFLCLVLFFYIFLKLGPLNIWLILKKVTVFNFLILFVIRFFYWLYRTFIWKKILSHYGSFQSLYQLFLAKLAGHAVGYLTATAKIGGEATRILMVKNVTKKKVIASVIVDKTIELVVMALFFLIVVIIGVLSISMPNSRKIYFFVFSILIVLLSVSLLRIQKKGLLIWFVDLLIKMKLKFKFFEKNRMNIEQTDSYISDFLTTKKKAFINITILSLFHPLIWTAEIFLTFLFLKAENVTFFDCFFMVTIGAFSTSLPIIPASLGIYEVTYISLFALLDINITFGLAMILIRRILGFIWAGLGVIPMLTNKNRKNYKESDIYK